MLGGSLASRELRSGIVAGMSAHLQTSHFSTDHGVLRASYARRVLEREEKKPF